MITPDTVKVQEVSLFQVEHEDNVNLSDVVLFISQRMSLVKQGKRINNSVESITAFLKEVMKRAQVNKETLLLASIYFKNLVLSYSADLALPDFACCGKRLLLVCLILAHKFSNDMTFSMRTWAHVSGLPTKSISIMERWCLKQLNYGLYVTKDTLNDWATVMAGYHSNTKKRALESEYLPNKRVHRNIV